MKTYLKYFYNVIGIIQKGSVFILGYRKKHRHKEKNPYQKFINILDSNIHRNSIIRNARILTSERLKKYAEHWNVIFVCLNIMAIIGVLISISDFLITKRSSLLITFVSSIFSLYVILVQDFVGKKNYTERSLRMHYHQLSLKRINNKLIMLKQLVNYLHKKKLLKDIELFYLFYYEIQEERIESLSGYENHDEDDYLKAKYENIKGSKHKYQKRSKYFWKYIDLSIDSVFLFFQWIVIYLILSVYLYLLHIMSFKTSSLLFIILSVIYILFKIIRSCLSASTFGRK